MANSDPRNSEELSAPIFQASVAAAMEYDVKVVCTAKAGKLMKKGVADKLRPTRGSRRTLYDFIKDACEAGVKFYCCTPNLGPHRNQWDELIPECGGIIGSAHLIEEIMEREDVKVLSY